MTDSAQDELFDYTKGYYLTKALLATWRLGLLDAAVQGAAIDAEAWSTEHGCDPQLVRSLLGYLVTRDFFQVVDGRYRLSERGQRTAPYYGYLPMHVGSYEPIFGNFEDVLTGRQVYGRDLHRTEAELVSGMSSMEEHLLTRLTAITDGLASRGIVDLGCGSGRLLARLLARDERLHGLGVDREPAACEQARRTFAATGLAERATVVQADASQIRTLPSATLADTDLAIAMFVMHEVRHQLPQDQVIRCLQDIAAAVGPDGHFVMVEVSRISGEQPRPGLSFVPEYQLVHDFSHQRLATMDEWHSLFAEAGMQVLKTEPAGMCEAFCLLAAPA